MRYVILFVILFPVLLMAQSDHSKSVLHGQREGFDNPDNTYRVFLDRNGDLYPALVLSDDVMAKAGASLEQVFADRPGLFSTRQASFRAYQDSVATTTLEEVNRLAEEATDVFVLVHGFRKPFRPTSGGRTAEWEYRLLRQWAMNARPSGKKPLFIEVYWDGTYDCCFSLKTKRNREIFELFEQRAQQHATTTGYRLRPLLAGIETERLHLIGHSLGTRVLAAATFDAYEAPAELTGQETPAQPVVNICLVAPAIAGGPFERYYQRGGTKHSGEDNYSLAVFFNRKDFVLKKRFLIFGPGPRKFGDTSLGADRRKSIAKLADLFRTQFTGSPVSAREVEIGLSHALRDYGSTDQFKRYLEQIWR